jgi:hypothetical protein
MVCLIAALACRKCVERVWGERLADDLERAFVKCVSGSSGGSFACDGESGNG